MSFGISSCAYYILYCINFITFCGRHYCFPYNYDFISEQDSLLNVAFEAGPAADDDNVKLHLWTYRPRVSLDHLRLAMSSSKDMYPLLWDFLQFVRSEHVKLYLYTCIGSA